MFALRFTSFGEPLDVLQPQELPLPEVGPGEARVRLLLRPVNPSDLYQIRGKYGRLPDLPATPGLEGLGVVEALGSGVEHLEIGQRVIFREVQGTWAEQVVYPADGLIAVPAEVPEEAAAQAMVNPLTALAMVEHLAPPPGSWVVQTAAGSAVGRCVADLARSHGFHVLSLVRREEQAEALRHLGEAALSTASEGWVDAARKLMDAEAHAVLDAVGGRQASSLTRLLRPEGTLLVYGALSLEPLLIPGGQIIYREFSVEGFMVTRWKRRRSRSELFAALGRVFDLQSQGLLCPTVAGRYSLQDFPEALRQAEAPGKGGKVLLG